MRLYLKNIGMIKEADVKLDGLTVIAGENDTGKSTVGKVIFSIVKGIQKYEENIGKKIEDRIEEIGKILIDLSVRKLLKKDDKINELNELNLLLSNLDKLNKNKINLNEFLSSLKKLDNKEIKSIVKEIENLILKDEKSLKEEALKRSFFSEFRTQLKLNNIEYGEIKLTENNEENIKIIVKNEIELNDEFSLILEDVTLIETPMILNFSNMIQSARSHFEEEELNKNKLSRIEPDIVYHSKDLINKLVNSVKYNFDKKIDNELLNFLKFDFDYIDETKEFIYVKNNKKYYMINTADGIKSFGIIKILLKGQYIRKNTLLVIDEPEVHLHPKWQIEYAKLIVELVKKGIKVLITSHSPFFIDAIDKLSYDIKRNYYFAENGIIKKDNDLKLMYEKLNVAIDELEDLEIEEMFFKAKYD